MIFSKADTWRAPSLDMCVPRQPTLLPAMTVGYLGAIDFCQMASMSVSVCVCMHAYIHTQAHWVRVSNNSWRALIHLPADSVTVLLTNHLASLAPWPDNEALHISSDFIWDY